MSKFNIGDSIFTPLGIGEIVYLLPDGTLVVEFEHGGGCIFMPDELFVGTMDLRDDTI